MRYPDEGTHEGIEFTFHHPPFLIFRDHFRTAAGILLPQPHFDTKAGILLPQHRSIGIPAGILLPQPSWRLADTAKAGRRKLASYCPSSSSSESWHLTATTTL